MQPRTAAALACSESQEVLAMQSRTALFICALELLAQKESLFASHSCVHCDEPGSTFAPAPSPTLEHAAALHALAHGDEQPDTASRSVAATKSAYRLVISNLETIFGIVV